MSSRLTFVLALLLAFSLALAQSGATKPDPVLKQKGLRFLDNLATKSDKLQKQALDLARKGGFEAAEAPGAGRH